MANSLGERVKIQDNPVTGEYHYEYRSSKDRIRLMEEDKVRRKKISLEAQMATMKLKKQRNDMRANIKEMLKQGRMTRSDADRQWNAITEKFKGIPE